MKTNRIRAEGNEIRRTRRAGVDACVEDAMGERLVTAAERDRQEYENEAEPYPTFVDAFGRTVTRGVAS